MGQACCPRCGTNLAPDAPEGLCSACVLQVVVDQSIDEPLSGVTGEPLDPLDGGQLLEPGDGFGPYRIERLLGRGGMGDVYAAEQVEQGRRLAIKLLNRRLTGAEDRERFLREGQLAAAINHAHCVYVYGSEEIAGTPVITMELLPGGTLKDRVKARGPLGVTEAVDAILQVISGLEAAHRSGILHRDVKPSNCFLDLDQTVKVGDFGLSIPAQPPTGGSTARLSAFQGTPGFAPPEQLRGEALDLRADIYAVAATLYYLLTAEAPGGHHGLSALAAGIDAAVVPSPRAKRPDIPPPLAAFMLRCLSTDRPARPGGYDELRTALEPFGSRQAAPASSGKRIGAAVFDVLVLLPIMMLALAALITSRLVSQDTTALLLGAVLPTILYWGLCEGALGAAVGKRACGIHVVGPYGAKPGIVRGLLRSSMVVAPVALAFGTRLVPNLPSGSPDPLIVFAVSSVLLWSTARPSNGLRGLHEVLTGTRVVSRSRADAPVATPAAPSHLTSAEAEPRVIGPYGIVALLGATGCGELFLGVDPRLKRQVWVHVQPPGTAPVSHTIRDLSRATRLRWLNGHRSAHAAWDAYEAVDGAPVLNAPTPTSWRTARTCLLDLANELDTAAQDGSLGELSLERVWITSDQRLKLLDFRAPGLPDGASVPACSSLTLLRALLDRFFKNVPAVGLPLTALSLRRGLAQDEFPTPASVAAHLGASPGIVERVTRRQRGLALALTVLTYLFGTRFFGALLAIAVGLLAIVPPSVTSSAVRVVTTVSAAALAMIWAAHWRGGFWLHVFGIAVITADGREVSSSRAMARAAIAWTPAWLATIAVALHLATAVLLITLGHLFCVLYAADHPQRGLHD